MTAAPGETPDTRPAAFLQGLTLQGATPDGGWRVIGPLTPRAGKTGGNFSIGYIAERVDVDGIPTGEEGFVKAIDFSRWADFAPDLVDALLIMTQSFQFERDLVAECTRRNLRNVVRGVDHGVVEVGNGPLRPVNFLVFEVADGDVRDHLDAMADFDVAWAMRVIHNVAKGLRQLHALRVRHQDLKPSNVLMFPRAPLPERAKLGDLGRSGWTGHAAPHDRLLIRGDPMYAPPEGFYGFSQGDDTIDQRAADVYHLGSMVAFLFTKVGMTANLFTHISSPVFLPPTLHGGTWGGTFDQVLPHLRIAFGEAIDAISPEVPEHLRADTEVTIRQLCDPDPRLRGNPRAGAEPIRRYALDFFVSRFDLLAYRAELAFKRGFK